MVSRMSRSVKNYVSQEFYTYSCVCHGQHFFATIKLTGMSSTDVTWTFRVNIYSVFSRNL